MALINLFFLFYWFQDYSSCFCWKACLQDPIFLVFSIKRGKLFKSVIFTPIGLNKHKNTQFTAK